MARTQVFAGEDKVLIEKIDESKSTSGILVAKTANKKAQRGKVAFKSLGLSSDYEVDDEVIYDSCNEVEVTIEGKSYVVVGMTDIHVRIRKF